ncbi:winged helix-turn-helix domain-containing protein [Micromonospora sp. NPDC049679]|uniref:winged helix-turn-helix domain-containing protein n=1 Tax=Micromonospora sp. NPDC049679 TaxID=3155920 RepID=UPI00340C5DD6
MPPYRHAYQRIVDDVVADIEAGRLKPGDKLPSGRELREKYEVSAMVVRTAVTILRDRGLVESVSGVGVFVLDRPAKLPS